MTKTKDKLIHDLNSAISTLEQSLQLLCQNYDKDLNLTGRMLPLCADKIVDIKNDWHEVKKIIKSE